MFYRRLCCPEPFAGFIINLAHFGGSATARDVISAQAEFGLGHGCANRAINQVRASDLIIPARQPGVRAYVT
jgi:4'-phosphopantetheinyl transferase EntD